MNISALILTKNEEKNISECISGLKFCDEIIVIDDNSSDNTVEIAKRSGAKVFQRNLDRDFAGQRNYALEKASGKWVFFVDADERVSDELRKEIKKEIDSPDNPHVGYFVRRDDYMWGKKLKYGETGGVLLLRLARKSAGKWVRSVHEVWKAVGRTKTLRNPLKHYSHQTLREFISDINFHSDLHAVANYKEGKRSSWVKILFWPRAHGFKNWVLKLGFLDGTEGFVFALIMSFHSFLSWSKLWIKERKK